MKILFSFARQLVQQCNNILMEIQDFRRLKIKKKSPTFVKKVKVVKVMF